MSPSPLHRSPRVSYVLLTWFLVSLGEHPGAASAERPEVVLREVLSKPFAPTDWGSTRCLRDSALYLSELARYTPWALKMYDASAKIPSGVITGNYKQLGNYDECLGSSSGGPNGFVGQACSANVHFEITPNGKGSSSELREPDMADLLPSIAVASNATKWTSGNSVSYEWLWCVPSSCNHSEVQEALEIALDPLKVEGRVDLVVSVPKESCHTVDGDRKLRSFDSADWIYTSILATFALIIIVSTSYDIAKRGHLRTLNRKDRRHVLLTSFSFYTNGKNLWRTERSRDAIGCLDGLRYLSICWIIYGHTHYSEVVGTKMNLSEVPWMHLNWSTMLVLNGNIVTDTFFLLSGILLAYTELTKKQKEEGHWRFSVIGLYLHRYLRLTPAYAMMIGFYATLFYKFGSGPHWDNWVGSNRNYCRENWWTNLLYVNNYVNVPSMCMSQSWYLATDMQLVWLSPIFLYPMLKFTRGFFFWLVSSLALFLSVLLPFFITYFLKLTGTMLYYKEQSMVSEVYTQVYTRVYNRFGPYVIGLIVGYVLHKTKSRTIKIPAVYLVAGWLIAAVAGLSAVFGPRGMYFDSHHYDRVEASFYAGLHRHVFVLSISWIVFCSVHGYAGFLGHFLSWRVWTPLSKLTYTAYLCHYVFVLSDVGFVRTTNMLSTIGVLRSFFANLCLTMILSAIWSLCFEMPFMTIDRSLISRRRHHSALSGKPNQGKVFGSIDSSKEIYRPTEESTSTLSQYYSEELSSSKDTYLDNEAARLEPSDEQRDPPRIYVIGSPLRDPFEPSCESNETVRTSLTKGYQPAT